MEPGEWARKALDIIENETRDLIHVGPPLTPRPEPDVEIAALIQKVGASSISEVEKIIEKLQEAKDFLESERERVQHETERYTTLTQMASASVKIISDTVAGWREAGHPLRNDSRSSQFDVTPSASETAAWRPRRITKQPSQRDNSDPAAKERSPDTRPGLSSSGVLLSDSRTVPAGKRKASGGCGRTCRAQSSRGSERDNRVSLGGKPL
jgi:hypothetical protein